MQTFIDRISTDNVVKLYKKIYVRWPKLWFISLVSITFISALGVFSIRSVLWEEKVGSQVASTTPNESAEPQAVSALGFLKPEDEVTNLSGAVPPEGTRLAPPVTE